MEAPDWQTQSVADVAVDVVALHAGVPLRIEQQYAQQIDLRCRSTRGAWLVETLSVDQSNQLPRERGLRPLDEPKLDQAKELTQRRCDTETTAADELKRSSRTKSKRESNKTSIIQKVRVAGEEMSAADWVRQYGHTSLDCRALLLGTSTRARRWPSALVFITGAAAYNWHGALELDFHFVTLTVCEEKDKALRVPQRQRQICLIRPAKKQRTTAVPVWPEDGSPDQRAERWLTCDSTLKDESILHCLHSLADQSKQMQRS